MTARPPVASTRSDAAMVQPGERLQIGPARGRLGRIDAAGMRAGERLHVRLARGRLGVSAEEAEP
jgi:hypothetical protein